MLCLLRVILFDRTRTQTHTHVRRLSVLPDYIQHTNTHAPTHTCTRACLRFGKHFVNVMHGGDGGGGLGMDVLSYWVVATMMMMLLLGDSVCDGTESFDTSATLFHQYCSHVCDSRRPHN